MKGMKQQHTIQTLLFRTHSVDGKNPVLQDFTVITHQYTVIACISTYLKECFL